MKQGKTNLFTLGTKELQAYCVAQYITQIGGLSMALQEIKQGQKQKRITKQDAQRKRDYLKKAFAMYGNVTETVTPTTTAEGKKPFGTVTETVTPQVLQIDFSEFKTAKEFYKYCTYQIMKQKGGLNVLLQRVEDAETLGKLPQERATRFKGVLVAINTKFAFKELFASVGQEVKRKQKIHTQSKSVKSG